jgi:hypothetical protein
MQCIYSTDELQPVKEPVAVLLMLDAADNLKGLLPAINHPHQYVIPRKNFRQVIHGRRQQSGLHLADMIALALTDPDLGAIAGNDEGTAANFNRLGVVGSKALFVNALVGEWVPEADYT